MVTPPRAALVRYLSCVRPGEILVLQGPPLLGAAFALVPPRIEYLGPLLVLLAANVFLMAHVFVLNDWSNVAMDLADSNKRTAVFTRHGVTRPQMGGFALSLLLVSLALFASLGLRTWILSLGIAGLSALYSLPGANWKARPFFSSLAHLVGGVVHFLLGYSIGRPLDQRGVLVAAFFGLTFAAGHLVQELRDYHGDASSSVRTNAVEFGPKRAFAASLALFGLAHLVLAMLAWHGLIPPVLGFLVLAYPIQLAWSLKALAADLTYAAVCQLQTRYRVLYAAMGVVIIGALWYA